ALSARLLMPSIRSHSPIVAVIIGREPAHRYSVHRGYLDAVVDAGGIPIVLPATDVDGSRARLLDVAEQADALLLTGGGDVDPTLYDSSVAAEVYDVDPVRDALEIDALRSARARGRRVLGICRGMQLM